MPWKKQTWVDDDGSLTVGTEFDAEKMNNIELGVGEGIADGLAASGMAGSALLQASSGVTAAGSALVTAQDARQVAGSALFVGQGAQSLALSAIGGAASGINAAKAALDKAGSALVTGQEANVVAGSALFTGQQANVAAGSALVTGQNANALAASGVTAAGSALVTAQQANARAASGVTAAGSALVTGQAAGALAASGVAAAGSALADIVQIDQFTAGSGMGYVFHGSSASIARPQGVGGVLWIGTVEPANALANDPWLDISGVRPGPRDWGEVTELPKNPSIGDKCTLRYDPAGEINLFNPGVLAFWHMEYDGQQPFGWKYIGGDDARRVFANAETESKTFVSTGMPSLTIPIEGDYEYEFGSLSILYNPSVSSAVYARMRPLINGEVITEAELATVLSSGGTTTGFRMRSRSNFRTGIPATFQLQLSVDNGVKTRFAQPFVAIRPRRLAG